LLTVSRRDFLSAALLAPALARLQPPAGGQQLLGTIPFSPGAPHAPLNRLLGVGLDARLFTDLSAVTRDQPVTPADRFFVRTAAGQTLPEAGGWTLTLGGLVQQAETLDVAALERLARPGGRYLIECAGNADPANYGLISVADWDGVPLAALLDRMRPTTPAHRVLVTGFDDESVQPRTSIPGASWIFSRDDLAPALLALRMNGAPLARDHGAPIRLVVPGWYGCACIKWVTRVDLVADTAPATSQMWEYANRTHQAIVDSRDASGSSRPGPPQLARDYTPALVDTAAVPVRIEQWRIDGTIAYRVVGIIWGGGKPTNALAIRFKTSEPWVPVEDCPLPASTLTWSLWTHTWRPADPGRYEIVLKVTDQGVRTRRLDLFYYVREVQIDEV
jgi:DMSO/TMAO reductase YedYZ molybdopterin-dependent catalytic subunit